ncbi:TolC family protein [Herminiimonas sp. CN]|uniref:TolC family protein n=1 Tax=Herminiimonas sp. CN TaxID=1349818 RepID=UPI0004738E83|nr:TolC family protein [Herminiimonas sp. CN]
MKKSTSRYRRFSLIVILSFFISESQGSETTKAISKNPKSFAVAPPAVEGTPIPLSMADAVSLGLRNNRAIRSAYLQRISQKFNLRVAESKFTPQLSINGSYLNMRDSSNGVTDTTALTPAATINIPTGAQLSLTWANTSTKMNDQNRLPSSVLTLSFIQPLLRNAGRDISLASVRTARIDESINILNLKITISQSIIQIIFSYREFLRAQNQLKIAEDALSRSQSLLKINNDLINVGRMAKIDIIQTEADVASQELAVEEAANQIDSARLALLSLLAIDSRANVLAVDAFFLKPISVDVNEALSIALEHQPEYLSALLSIERAKINLGVAKNQRLWDLSIVAAVTHNKNTSFLQNEIAQGQQKNTYVGLQLAIPLTDLTHQQAEVAASTNLQSETLQMEELRQSIEQRVRDAVRNVQTRWRQFEIAQRARNLSLKKLEAEREKLQVGRSSNFQVLSFESDLRNAENAQLNTMNAYLNALTILDQQQGKTLDSWQITPND